MCLSELLVAPTTSQESFGQYDDSTSAYIDSSTDVIYYVCPSEEVSVMQA